jgi:hypothetical protein
MRTITDDQIDQLRLEAVDARDWLRVAVCCVALGHNKYTPVVAEHLQELIALGIDVGKADARAMARALCSSVICPGTKDCTCCGTTYTLEGWQDLPYTGRMPVEMREPGEPAELELRNCPCGTTMSVGIMDDGAIVMEPELA